MSYGREQTRGGQGYFAGTKARSARNYRYQLLLPAFFAMRMATIAALIALIGLAGNWISILGGSGNEVPADIKTVLGFAVAGALFNLLYTCVPFFERWWILLVAGLFNILWIIYFSLAATEFASVAFAECFNLAHTREEHGEYKASSFAASLHGKNFSTKVADWVVYSTEQCNELRGAWGMFIALPIFLFLDLMLVSTMAFFNKSGSGKGSGKGSKGHHGDMYNDYEGRR